MPTGEPQTVEATCETCSGRMWVRQKASWWKRRGVNIWRLLDECGVYGAYRWRSDNSIVGPCPECGGAL